MLIAKFESKLVVCTYFIFLTAFENLIVDLKAGAKVITLIWQLESFPALWTHANVIANYAQEDRRSAGAAQAVAAVKPPAAYMAEK